MTHIIVLMGEKGLFLLVDRELGREPFVSPSREPNWRV